MNEWHPAVLRNRRQLDGGLFTFTLEPPDPVRGSFHSPGQYHRLNVAGVGEAYFALASAPNRVPFEYLGRVGTPVADALVEGAEVTVTAMVGPGYPLARAFGRNLLLVATGTGIAPIRSVIQTLLPQRHQLKRVQLVYGARAENAVAYASELDAWRKAGIDVQLTLTQKHPSWAGAVGRVQARLTGLDLDDTLAFVCGQPEMEAQVIEILTGRGVQAGHIFVNH